MGLNEAAYAVSITPTITAEQAYQIAYNTGNGQTTSLPMSLDADKTYQLCVAECSEALTLPEWLGVVAAVKTSTDVEKIQQVGMMTSLPWTMGNAQVYITATTIASAQNLVMKTSDNYSGLTDGNMYMLLMAECTTPVASAEWDICELTVMSECDKVSSLTQLSQVAMVDTYGETSCVVKMHTKHYTPE